MLKQLKQAIRDTGVWFFRLIGSEIQDCRTGKPLGRGLIFYWGGRVHLLGCDCAVVPVPMPPKALDLLETIHWLYSASRGGLSITRRSIDWITGKSASCASRPSR
jgi:hypothetical protein